MQEREEDSITKVTECGTNIRRFWRQVIGDDSKPREVRIQRLYRRIS